MIRTLRRRRLRTLTCLLAVATLWFAVVNASGRHTDDGCRVELHCFTCQWALSGAAVTTHWQPLDPGLELVGRTSPPEPPGLIEVPPPESATRGPPAA